MAPGVGHFDDQIEVPRVSSFKTSDLSIHRQWRLSNFNDSPDSNGCDTFGARCQLAPDLATIQQNCHENLKNESDNMSGDSDSEMTPIDDHWEIYVTFVDENPSVILVDLGISAIAPLPDKPSLAWVWVHIASPDEEGFPSEEEDMRLNEVEDAITDALEDSSAQYVGRITTDGRREFYFYMDNPAEFRTTVTSAMSSTPQYEFEIDEAEDPEWEHYFNVLYPSPEDFQQIHNQHVISKLYEAGDSLTEPRQVDHFANFQTEEDREQFVSAAAELGYEATSRPAPNEESEFPYNVGLVRVDAVDAETIDRITFELFDLARKFEGEYEGWGSKVVKSA